MNIEDITWPRGDTKFISEFSTKLSELKGGSEHYEQDFLEVFQTLGLKFDNLKKIHRHAVFEL